jgi:hypothetical protein
MSVGAAPPQISITDPDTLRDVVSAYLAGEPLTALDLYSTLERTTSCSASTRCFAPDHTIARATGCNSRTAITTDC